MKEKKNLATCAAQSENVIISLSPEEMAQIKKMIRETHLDQATVIRKLVKLGLKAWKTEYALGLYKEGRITISKAAEVAETSVYGILEVIRRRKIPYRIYTEDLREVVRASARARAEFYRLLEQLGKE